MKRKAWYFTAEDQVWFLAIDDSVATKSNPAGSGLLETFNDDSPETFTSDEHLTEILSDYQKRFPEYEFIQITHEEASEMERQIKEELISKSTVMKDETVKEPKATKTTIEINGKAVKENVVKATKVVKGAVVDSGKALVEYDRGSSPKGKATNIAIKAVNLSAGAAIGYLAGKTTATMIAIGVGTSLALDIASTPMRRRIVQRMDEAQAIKQSIKK